ncbi:MAG: cytochrome P450 [Pseudomonadota bacterium]
MAPSPFDPSDPAILADPYEALAQLRKDDPVHWHPGLKSWVVTRYDDVRALLLGDDLSVSRLTAFYRKLPEGDAALLRDIVGYLNLWIAFRDPPDHTRMRRIMRHAFTGRAMTAMETGVAPVVDLLLDGLEGRGRIEAIADYAGKVPAFVIMDLLDIPRARFEEFRRWSDDLAVFIGGARRADDKYERAHRGCAEMAGFFRDLVAERRATPQNGFVDDLIAARDDGEALGEDELVATCILVLFAGHETTSNLIGNALLTLLRHPETLSRFLADPALTDRTLEEVMRFDGPTGGLVRVVAKDHELRGRRLGEGERVIVMVTGANRDPEVFPDPDVFDIDRAPNRHLTFGQGVHLCIGARLAREEGRVAVRRFFDRFPTAALAADDAPEWRDALVPRGLTALPLDLKGAAG